MNRPGVITLKHLLHLSPLASSTQSSGFAMEPPGGTAADEDAAPLFANRDAMRERQRHVRRSAERAGETR